MIDYGLTEEEIEALFTDTLSQDALETLVTMSNAVLVDETYSNVYYYKTRRLNTAANLASNSYVNVWLKNNGSNTIRFYTKTQAGTIMHSATVSPGQGKLFVINNSTVVRHGSQTLPGLYALSYSVHADTVNGNAISFNVRVRHYDS